MKGEVSLEGPSKTPSRPAPIAEGRPAGRWVALLARWDRTPAWPLGWLPVLCAAAVVALTFDPREYDGGDDLCYWALGRSLAEGRGYRDLVAPGAPFETSIPWGFPALLAGAMRLQPWGYAGAKLVTAACFVGAIAALWSLLARWFPTRRLLALGLVTAVLVNGRLHVYGSLLLSEAPYLLASTLSLLAWERGRDRPPADLRAPAAAAAWASLAYLVRPAGIALLAAVLAVPVLRRRWRAAATVAAVMALLAGSWHVRNAFTPRERPNLYASYLLKKSKFQSTDDVVDASGLLSRAVHNARAYTLGPLVKLTAGAHTPRQARWPVATAALVLIAAGLWARSIPAGPVHLYLPAYTAVLLLWLPESVRDRYLAMLFPFLLAVAGAGAAWLSDRHRLVRGLPLALCTLLLAPQAAALPSRVQHAARIRAGFHGGDPLAGRPAGYRSFVDLNTWLRDQAPEGAVIASRKPRHTWYFSGRPAVQLTYATDPDVVLAALDGQAAQYLLIDRLDGAGPRNTRRRLTPVLDARSERFDRVYVNPWGDSVWRVLPAPTPAGTPP